LASLWVRRTTRTSDKKLAEQYEVKLKQELWRRDRLGEAPPRGWQEAVMSWSLAKKEKASWGELKRHLLILDPYLRGKLLKDISADDVDCIKADRLAQGLAPATANRTLEVMRSILRMALKRGWLQKLPPIELLDEPDIRIRWITPEEADKLIQELEKKKRTQHLAEMVRFSLATGLRESNVTGLEWSRVDLERRVMWVEGYQSKNGEAFHIPLSAEAVLVLRRQREKKQHRPRGKRPVGLDAQRYVFTYYGRKVGVAHTKTFRDALKAAGIANFRWHDLRPHGPPGTSRTARPCPSCSSSAAGRRWRWSCGTPISAPATWPSLPTTSRGFEWLVAKNWQSRPKATLPVMP
jgi:integrase